MRRYEVSGMSCAACSAAVERAVSAVPGVTGCTVSLLTNSVGVEGTADAAAVVAAVEKAGYGARVADAPAQAAQRFHNRVVRQRVQFQRHDGAPALLLAKDAHGRNVHARAGQHAGHMRDGARRVQVADDQGVCLARKVDLQPVDGLDADASAANGSPLHAKARAAAAARVDDERVGMRIAQDDRREGKGNPLRAGDFQAVAQADIVHVHVQQSADDRAVRAVAPVGLGKRTVQADMRGYTKDGADFLAGGTRLEPGASFAVTADGRELFIQIGSVVRK